MPSRSPRRRQAHGAPGDASRNGGHRSPATTSAVRRRVTPVPTPRPRHAGVLPRSSSETALWTGRSASGGSDGRDHDDVIHGALQILPRYFTCTDLRPTAPGLALSPSPPRSTEGYGIGDVKWEGKVLVTVTVEGSPGPVRAMVRLGASVEEAIGTVVDAYSREGRSPKLDPTAVSSFQLHHNHFCLQSLNKADTLGQVGGRNFYLRRNTAGSGEAAAPTGGQEVTRDGSCPQPLVPLSSHRLLAIIARRLSKLGRRVMKLWRALGCATCS